MHGKKHTTNKIKWQKKLGGKKMGTYSTNIKLISLMYRVPRSQWEKDNPMGKK